MNGAAGAQKWHGKRSRFFSGDRWKMPEWQGNKWEAAKYGQQVWSLSVMHWRQQLLPYRPLRQSKCARGPGKGQVGKRSPKPRLLFFIYWGFSFVDWRLHLFRNQCWAFKFCQRIRSPSNTDIIEEIRGGIYRAKPISARKALYGGNAACRFFQGKIPPIAV